MKYTEIPIPIKSSAIEQLGLQFYFNYYKFSQVLLDFTLFADYVHLVKFDCPRHRCNLQKLDLKKSEVVFQKGDLPNGLYLITQGSVGIFMPTNDGREPDFILPANEIFGEMGVIDGELRMATARAMEVSQVLLVDKEEFELKVAESDIFIRAVVRTLSVRLRKAQKLR